MGGGGRRGRWRLGLGIAEGDDGIYRVIRFINAILGYIEDTPVISITDHLTLVFLSPPSLGAIFLILLCCSSCSDLGFLTVSSMDNTVQAA